MGFKRDLVKNVKAFLQDVEKFRFDFETTGPVVAGISAVEATDRLKRFQMLYEQRERKYKAYHAGEQLFGLPPTEYPELEKTKKAATGRVYMHVSEKPGSSSPVTRLYRVLRKQGGDGA